MSNQPYALYLAEVIESDPQSKSHHDAAASCLRRQHAEIERLYAQRFSAVEDYEKAPDWSLLEATQGSLREHMAEIHRLRAENAALRAELLNIGDLDKRNSIVRESGLGEWADWAQNRARHVARDGTR